MHRLCVIEGDGIGKEVIPAAEQILGAVIPDLVVIPAEAGWECFQKQGASVPNVTLQKIKDCGAAIFGAVSSPAKKVNGYRSAIITMRQSLELFANIRPIRSLPGISPRLDVNMLIVRENTEGLYAGRERLENEVAVAERVISRRASMRIGLKAVELLRIENRKRLSIIHKANILPVTDGLFRDCILEVISNTKKKDEDWNVDEILVDTAAMKIISEPQELDVLVTTNLFGDILSDEAAYWCGGMGLAPSINLGDDISLAEPVHGSAPDIAGKGIANPIAAILSMALLLRYSWKLPQEAERIETAVRRVLLNELDIQNGRINPETKTETITRAILDRLS
ncbi:MAG TPA: isocitrate/isopropylmalate dehydrogenase family protein [Leptolinea sp.]